MPDNGEQILFRLTTLETKFCERWKSHDERADERQALTCDKMDDIKSDIKGVNDTLSYLDKTLTGTNTLVAEKFAQLPCGERKGWYQSMGRQVNFMWLVLALMLTGVVALGWKGMAEKNTFANEIAHIQKQLPK